MFQTTCNFALWVKWVAEYVLSLASIGFRLTVVVFIQKHHIKKLINVNKPNEPAKNNSI